jgi:hypothetical protein
MRLAVILTQRQPPFSTATPSGYDLPVFHAGRLLDKLVRPSGSQASRFALNSPADAPRLAAAPGRVAPGRVATAAATLTLGRCSPPYCSRLPVPAWLTAAGTDSSPGCFVAGSLLWSLTGVERPAYAQGEPLDGSRADATSSRFHNNNASLERLASDPASATFTCLGSARERWCLLLAELPLCFFASSVQPPPPARQYSPPPWAGLSPTVCSNGLSEVRLPRPSLLVSLSWLQLTGLRPVCCLASGPTRPFACPSTARVASRLSRPLRWDQPRRSHQNWRRPVIPSR